MKSVVQTMTGIALLAALGWLGFNWYAQQRGPDTLPLSALPGDAVLAPATSGPAPGLSAAHHSVDAESSLTPAMPPGDVEIAHPVAVPPGPAPLPVLAQSDPEILAALVEMLDHATLTQYFQLESMARKFVVGVDNLAAGKLTPQNRLIKPVPGTFAVVETAQEIVLDAANYQRYTPLVNVLTGLDVTQVARVYRQFYPLLQQAYEDLGYPSRYFNDRLIAAIDHLLTASPLEPPIALEQPKVFYRFADPELEASSAGHKILFRVGPNHMVRVQQWLSALRAELATERPGTDEKR